MNPADFTPVIDKAVFPFLRIQQGRISKLADGPAKWREAYKAQLVDTLAAIDRFIPRPLTSVLDIAGGMGGFDALLNFVQPGLEVSILDGIGARPEVVERDQPYSDARAAELYLRENGVRNLWFFAPDRLPVDPPKFDLILSLQGWCFHFAPSVYMKFALRASRPGTVWILDVRTPQPSWEADLFSQERLEPIGTAPGFTEKYTRMAFKVV